MGSHTPPDRPRSHEKPAAQDSHHQILALHRYDTLLHRQIVPQTHDLVKQRFAGIPDRTVAVKHPLGGRGYILHVQGVVQNQDGIGG